MNNIYRGKERSQFILNVKILFFSFSPSLSLILSHTDFIHPFSPEHCHRCSINKQEVFMQDVDCLWLSLFGPVKSLLALA